MHVRVTPRISVSHDRRERPSVGAATGSLQWRVNAPRLPARAFDTPAPCRGRMLQESGKANDFHKMGKPIADGRAERFGIDCLALQGVST